MCESGTEAPLGQELAGADGEGLVALEERHRGVALHARGLLRDGLHLRGADAHRLLHHEGQPAVEEIVGDLRHLPVAPQAQHEVGLRLRQHLGVVGEGRRTAHRLRPLLRERGVAVLHADQGHVGHRGEMAEIGGVVHGVPVPDLDGGDANGHEILRRGRKMWGRSGSPHRCMGAEGIANAIHGASRRAVPDVWGIDGAPRAARCSRP